MASKKGQMNLPAALLMALLLGLLITVMMAMVTASLISAETVEPGAANIGSMAGLLLGGATAAIVAAGKMGKLRLPMCMAGAGVYFLGLLCLGTIVFDGVKSGVGVSALLVIGGALTACLLGLKGEKRQKHKFPKIRK